jgi:hypothetical protein
MGLERKVFGVRMSFVIHFHSSKQAVLHTPCCPDYDEKRAALEKQRLRKEEERRKAGVKPRAYKRGTTEQDVQPGFAKGMPLSLFNEVRERAQAKYVNNALSSCLASKLVS